VNVQGLVPTLVDGDLTLAQSLAICEYLEETHAEPPLLPQRAAARARVRKLALAIACDIHPLNNLRVLKYLTGELGISEEQKLTWYRHWVGVGFSGIEQQLAGDAETGEFCHGDWPGLADCCLVPQVFNARRYQVDLSPFPTIVRIDAACNTLPPFALAHPENQLGAR
jgi:maleylacetoacetate isomerase